MELISTTFPTSKSTSTEKIASIEIKDGMLVLDFSKYNIGNAYENIVYYIDNNILTITAEKQDWRDNTYWNDKGMQYGNDSIKITDLHPTMFPMMKTDTWVTSTGWLWWKKNTVHERTYIENFWIRMGKNIPQAFTSTNFTIIE